MVADSHGNQRSRSLLLIGRDSVTGGRQDALECVCVSLCAFTFVILHVLFSQMEQRLLANASR